MQGITVQIGPRESAGWLLGMRIPQLLLIGVALLCVLGLMNGSGPLDAMATRTDGPAGQALQALALICWLLLVATCLGVAFIPVRGRYLDQYVPVISNFMLQHVTGQDTFRGGIFRMSSTDIAPQITLPGDLAHLEFLSFDTGAGEVCIIKDPRAHTYTAVLVCEGRTFALADSAEQQSRVNAFGVMQTRLAQESSIISRLQIVERTEPDSGETLIRDLRHRGNPGTFQAAAYEQLLAVVPATQQAHETYVAVTIDARRATREIRQGGGGDLGASAVLFRELDSVAVDLESCGVLVEGWCPPRLLGYVIRTAYDPEARAMLDHRGGAGSDALGGDPGLPSGVDLAAAGPMRAENHWGYYRTDSAVHRCWWIAQWPRRDVPAGFLMPLLLESTCRRAISWTMEPVPVDRARRKLDRKLGDSGSEGRLRDRLGRRTSRQHVAEHDHLDRREAEIAAGYGVVRMIGYISTSAADLAELDAQSAEIERLAHISSVELTRLWGEHDQAFAAAALPLARGLR